MKARLSATVVAASLILSLGQASFANLVPANSTVVATAGAEPTGGTVSGNTGVLPFTSTNFVTLSNGFVGTLQSEVILNDPSNPFGPGALTFTYLLTNGSMSNDEIDRLTIGSFSGFQTDIDYSTLTTGQIPSEFTRSGSGSVVGFNFNPGVGTLLPGATARLLVIETNATGFSTANASIMNDENATVATFTPAPGSQAPEPTTALLVIPGLAMLLRRRRNVSI